MVDPKNVKSIFSAAAELPAGERAAYLDEAAAGDADIRARVEALLRAHDHPDSFLDEAAAGFAASLDFSTEEPPLAERPGTLIGPYKLLEQIGEGGMGVVYMADQQAPVRRRVALKIIKAGMDTRQVIARFEAERQALALMDHANIARVLDAGATDSGRPYFVMELVRGATITEYCDQNNLPIHERLELFVQVCHAVQHAHQKGIIHRDLKPTNVLVTVNDGRAVPKVIDFGVAKATGQQLTEKTLFTAFAQMVGTPLYMSPEQAEMTSIDVDTRSDVYSLGVLLYELLTGTTPFDKERLRTAAFDEIRRIIREEEPPSPSTRISTLDEARSAAARRQADPRRLKQLVEGDLDRIVLKCLDKDRTRRYETATGLAEDLHRYLSDEPVHAGRPTRRYRLKKFIRRNKAGVLAGAAIVAALGVGLALATIGFVQARSQAAIARKEAARSENVASFFKDMLKAAGPSVARGRDATILREILAKTAGQIDDDLNDQPEVRGDLWSTIGDTYREIGDFAQAADAYQHAVNSFRLALGSENAKLAIALCGLGACQSFQQDTVTGRANAQLGLDVARKCGDAEALATCLIGAAQSFRAWGQFSRDAQPYWREALALREQLGDDPVAIARCKYGLAGSLGEESAEGDALLREVLATYRQHLGTDSPQYAGSLFVLGQNLAVQGKLAEAEQVLRDSLELFRKIHDPSHPHQHLLRRILAATLAHQGKFSEAEAMLRAHAEEMPNDAESVSQLGCIYACQGEWPKAIEQFSEAIELTSTYDILRYQLPIALMQTDRHEEYRRFCHRYLDLAVVSEFATDRSRAAITALLLPVDGADFTLACQLADAPISNPASPDVHWALRLKALSQYRQGHFDLAREHARRAIELADIPPASQAAAWFVDAAASAQMQNLELARTSLAAGDELVRRHSIDYDSDLLISWRDWEIANILRREAAKLLGVAEPPPVTDVSPTP